MYGTAETRQYNYDIMEMPAAISPVAHSKCLPEVGVHAALLHVMSMQGDRVCACSFT